MRNLSARHLLLLAGGLFLAAPAPAQHGGVTTTVHNLSASGPGEIRAVNETEICKFCHVPHNAVLPRPLWGHALSRSEYDVPQVRGDRGVRMQAPQPDGSSRLCLSCHDGTVALGDVAGVPRPIPMSGSQRLGPERRGFVGTDLSGSHPISIRYPSATRGAEPDLDIGLRPLALVRAAQHVRLDDDSKVQCTTCHDPHNDRYHQEGRVPRFWVRPTVDEVCLTCHELL